MSPVRKSKVERNPAAVGRAYEAAPFGRGGPGGWVILDEPELHLGKRPDKVVPDLAGWRRERSPVKTLDEDAPGQFRVVPDWVCEVLSKRARRIDRGKKMRIHKRERVGWVWRIEPDLKGRVTPFHAIESELARLWSI